MEYTSRHELESRPDTYRLFHAEYCDPDRDVIELIDGEVVYFSNTVFYGGTADKLFILRAGVTAQQQLCHWLGSYDRHSGDVTIYDIANDVEINSNPHLGMYGTLFRTTTYEAKPRGDDDTTAYFHFNSQFIEWQEGDTIQPVDTLPLPHSY